MPHRGDDIEDDFVLDDLVALSGDEVDLDESPTEDQSSTQTNAGQAALATEKKRKRSAKQKEQKAKKRKLKPAEEDNPDSLAARPPADLATYLDGMQAKTYSKMSAIELADMRIPESSIADTSAWTGSRSLDQLPNFIMKMLPALRLRLGQKPKHHGAPTLIFIAGAALRVADATRILKSKNLRTDKSGDVAKLFAKHIKFEEHAEYLRRTRIASAAGTPGRVGKLLCESDALAISALTHIILDVTYRDVKKRSLLSIPETRDEVFRTVLGAPKVLQAIREGKVQVVLF